MKNLDDVPLGKWPCKKTNTSDDRPMTTEIDYTLYSIRPLTWQLYDNGVVQIYFSQLLFRFRYEIYREKEHERSKEYGQWELSFVVENPGSRNSQKLDPILSLEEGILKAEKHWKNIMENELLNIATDQYGRKT